MTTINVGFSHDYSAETLFLIGQISYIHKSTTATATFAAGQLTNILSAKLNVTGNLNANLLVVNGAALDASGWTFTAWDQQFDHLTLNGTRGDDTLTGGSQSDTIYGGSGNDILSDRGGADLLFGGDGRNTFRIGLGTMADIRGGTGKDRVEMVALPTDVGGAATLVLDSVETLSFGNFTGLSVALSSLTANSLLGGLTVISGGTGHDNHLSLNPIGDTDYRVISFVNWSADNGIYIPVAFAQTVHGSDVAETFRLLTALPATLYGDGGNDLFEVQQNVGNLGIDGGAGIDRLLIVRPAVHQESAILSDMLLLTGIEEIEFGSFGLDVGMPTVRISASQIADGITTIIGGRFSNLHDYLTVQLYGADATDLSQISVQSWNLAKDVLTVLGSSGNNAIVGFATDSLLYGGNGNDTVTGVTGYDQLFGGNGNDLLNGGGGPDKLLGGDGDDVLIGGSGIDNLYGGAGNDRFVLLAQSDSGPEDGLDDTIHGFIQGSDIIDLSAIDARAGGLDNAFTFLGSDAFTLHRGELRVTFNTSGFAVVQADIDGNGVADFQIATDKHIVLVATDFAL